MTSPRDCGNLPARMIGSARYGYALLLALGTAPMSCLYTPPPPKTNWPPDDYYLEVSYQRDLKERRQVRIWANGFVVYREASTWLGGPEMNTTWIPVFDTVSSYELRWQSIRALSRELERSGLRSIPPVGDPGDITAEQVVVHWRAFGDSGTIWARGQVRGAVARVLHVINSYMPEGRRFDLRAMVGESEPRHVVEVPAPVRSVVGSLEFHDENLLSQLPDAYRLLVDTFALALTAGKINDAEWFLARIEAIDFREQIYMRAIDPVEVADQTSVLRLMLQDAGGLGN